MTSGDYHLRVNFRVVLDFVVNRSRKRRASDHARSITRCEGATNPLRVASRGVRTAGEQFPRHAEIVRRSPGVVETRGTCLYPVPTCRSSSSRIFVLVAVNRPRSMEHLVILCNGRRNSPGISLLSFTYRHRFLHQKTTLAYDPLFAAPTSNSCKRIRK